MCYAVIGLNRLIKNRAIKLSTKGGRELDLFAPEVIWDRHIATLRSIQVAFANCLRDTLPSANYRKWFKTTNDPALELEKMFPQYLDYLTIL
jgi:hypothetical protein